MTLLRWLTFLLGSQTVILIIQLFWIYFLLLTLVFVLQWISLHSDHFVISVSVDFPTNSQQDAPFHCIAYDYSHAGLDWDGLHDHLRDVPWQDIFIPSVLLLLLKNFVSGFRLELMYISFIENIRSCLIHLHSFQLLVLLS